MSSDSIVKSVAKELKYYCDVKRLEDGFDLSGINNYRVDNSVYPVVHNDHGPREEQVKRKIRKHMTNYHFLSTKIPEYYYIYSARPQILPRSKTSLGGPVKSAKKRPKSVKNGWNQSKRNISEIMTKKETDRLVNAAAKLLVATETVESIDSARTPRPQTAPRSFEENRRPHTAKYTYDINGRKVFNTQLTYYDENHTRTKPKRSQSGRSPINRPGSPTPSQNTSDDTYASSISVDDIQRLKTPAPPRPKTTAKRTRNRTYISDNKTPDEEEVAVSKTMQRQDNDTVGMQTENKLLEKYDHMEDEVKEGPFAEYQIFIQTGNTNGASTKSDAKLTLYGEKGRSKEFVLAESKNHKVKFQKGKEDYFMIAAHHVGKLRKIKIGHDRPELSYAWYLENITVSDMYDKRVYDLPCGRWLSGQNGDRNTYVYLPVQRDRAFIETLETSCESTKPREKSATKHVSKTPNNNKEKKRGKSMEMKHVKSESDDGEYEDSVGAEKNSKKKPTNGRVSESSYTTSDSEEEEESYSESQTESESGQVISLKNSPVHKSKSQSRRVSNDSSNKANGPTFTFRSKDGGETKHTQDKNSPVKNSEDKMDSGNKKVVDKDYLLGYKAGLEAAQKENIKKREEQMDEEKKLLTKGQTIHEAAWNGNLERVKQLVEHFPEMKESKDGNGLVPLHKAVINGQTGVTKWLATCGVDLDIETPTSYTPMHLAALHGHVNVMMVLSALGASVKCATIEKQTPLHLAARGGHLECVKWLVANRADITGEDTFGRKPVYLAEEFEQDTVADFLRACEKELSNPNSGFALMYGSSIEGEVSQSPTPKVTDDKMSNVSDKGKAGSDDEEEEEEENTETVSTADKTKIEERRKSYDEQHYKMTERGKSFLDSIRQDIEEDEEESNA